MDKSSGNERERLCREARLLAVAAGALAAAVGLAAACGWIFDVELLRSFLPNYPEMKFNAALCFVLCGASLLTQALEPRRVMASRVCAAAVVVVSGLTLCEYVIGRGLGVDELFSLDRSDEGPYPGRIPLAGAINFLLMGVALLAIDVKTQPVHRPVPVPVYWPSQWLVLVVAGVSFVVVVGYAYDVSSLYRPRSSNPVALHGVLTFLLLCGGLLAARPDQGMVARALADDAGGLLVRRMLLPALLAPLVLGWLRLQGEQAALFGPQTALAIYVTAMVAVLVTLIWNTAGAVAGADGQRREADRRAVAQLARLDLLSHITRAIAERQDLHSIFQVVIRNLEDHLPIDFGCVLLHDASSGVLKIDAVGTRGAPLAGMLAMSEDATLAIENGLASCMQGELVHEPDLAQVELRFARRLADAGLRSLVLAPLVVEGAVIGVLAGARRAAHSFSSADCEFMRQLSEHVALATHQAQLHGALRGAYEELRQTQQAVMQQERLRALGQMASGIAHDINNAISPVTLLTEHLMEREAGLSASGRQSLVNIARAIDDVAATVARMRDFYRPREAGLPTLPMNLNHIVQQVTDLTRARWSDMPLQRGIVIQLRTELASDAPVAMGMEGEVREALINLLFNAVDAMPEGGTLTLRTRTSASGGAVLDVEDTGTGMDEDTRRRCLEPFFTTKGERGTGLGLAMVYGTVERHGAHLDIRSAPGRGSTFTVEFPRAKAAPAPQQAAKDAPIAQPGLRILLVDDDPVVLMTLQAMLELDGHVVIAASGGQAGIDAFKAEQRHKSHVSIVITDLGMPYVDGRKVAQAVKQMSPSTPVVLLTGWGQSLNPDASAPGHVDAVLSKPPKLNDLRQTLARHAGRERVRA